MAAKGEAFFVTDPEDVIMVLAIPGFIWFLIAIILALIILGWVFGRRSSF